MIEIEIIVKMYHVNEFGRLKIIKMTNTKLSGRLNVTAIKVTVGFFIEIDKLILKFI